MTTRGRHTAQVQLLLTVAALRAPVAASDLLEAAGLLQGTRGAHGALHNLVERGLLTRLTYGVYGLGPQAPLWAHLLATYERERCLREARERRWREALARLMGECA